MPGPCDEAVLDAGGSTGAGQLTYIWGCANDAALHALLSRMPSQRIKLEGSQLPKSDSQYHITLYVKATT